MNGRDFARGLCLTFLPEHSIVRLMSRIASTFSRLKAENRTALIGYITAGDPNPAQSHDIMAALPESGVDIIELGMPFTDPMADGPTIQAAHIRALGAGMSLTKTLDMVRAFRSQNTVTPIVLMGYYNPVYTYGPERFARDAAAAGVDGLLIVDVPPEEDAEIRIPLKAAGIDLIRLIAPTSIGPRLRTLVDGASGFLYYVSITGVTGTAAINVQDVAEKLKSIRAVTDLPLAVGFGIRTPEDAKAISPVADGVIVGSAFVQLIEKTVPNQIVSDISRRVSSFRTALT